MRFDCIPGSPIAYWVGAAIFKAFTLGTQLRDLGSPRVGLQTGNNDRFLRLWFEVSASNCEFSATDCIAAFASGKKWFPHNKGGAYRKWYGNLDYIINYQCNGKLLRETEGAAVIPDRIAFQEAITYSRLGFGDISFRLQPKGCTFDSASVNAYVGDFKRMYILAFLNTNVADKIIKVLSPTVNTQPGDIAKLPILFEDRSKEKIDTLSQGNVSVTHEDWDAFETSWGFKKHPLI